MDTTFDDFLALLRRTTDEQGWLQPLLDDPSSAAVLGAFLKAADRLGGAAVHLRDALTIAAASGGRSGVAVVTLTRAAAGTTGVVPQGYQFVDPRGARVRSQTPVPVPPSATSVFVPVVTERQTELVNTEDDDSVVVAPDAPVVLDAGATTVLVAPPGAVGTVATTLAATACTQVLGGAVDMLSVHAGERGMTRQTGEQEEDLRARIRNIIDVVTPLAVADVVQAAAQVPGLPGFTTLEPFRDGATPDLKAARGLGSFDPLVWTADSLHGTTDFMDDLVSGRVLVDRRTAAAYFEVVATDYVLDVGRVASHHDDAFFDDPVAGFYDGYYSFPPQQLAGLLSILDGVDAKKPYATQWDLVLRDPDVAVAQGSSSSDSLVTAFTATPPVGAAWLVCEAFVGRDSADPVPGATWQLDMTLDDSSVVSTGEVTTTATVRLPAPGRLVTQLVGRVRSDGVASVHLVAQVRVHVIRGWPP